MTHQLPRKKVAKVWGRRDVAEAFGGETDEVIGEVWFEPDETTRGLLVKYLFTSEKLSVQVHPSDRQARRLGLGEYGKEECWIVMDAEPGAVVGLGLDQEYDEGTVRRAAEDGSIEDMLVWHEARRGDFFHVPPGTIHAIGAGLTILEVQQNTDITFRLFDYGRPRELHLDQALECALLKPYSAARRRSVGEGCDEILVDSPVFSVRLLCHQHVFAVAEPTLLVPLTGEVRVNSDVFEPGVCVAMETGDVVRSTADTKFVIIHDNRKTGSVAGELEAASSLA